TFTGWEDFEGNSLDSYTIPARSGIVALVGDSENSVQFASASQQVVNFGTSTDLQIERDTVMTIAVKFKVPTNPAAGTVLFGNAGEPNRGFQLAVLASGQLAFNLNNTPATNRYQQLTNTDYADNTWHDLVIRKPAAFEDTT